MQVLASFNGQHIKLSGYVSDIILGNFFGIFFCTEPNELTEYPTLSTTEQPDGNLVYCITLRVDLHATTQTYLQFY